MAATPQSQHACWAKGVPAQIASAFLKRTGKKRRSLGSGAYCAYVQAVGCAYAHGVLAGCPPGSDRAAQLANTLSTAEAIVAGLSAQPASDSEEELPEVQNDGDRLPILRRVLQQAQPQPQQQQQQQGASTSIPRSSSSTPAQPSDLYAHSRALPLPMDALFCIVHQLDAPSRAHAAAACKRLRWVVQQGASFAAASPALVGFIEALQLFRTATSSWTGCSSGNTLGLLWPADGSDVAGDDLREAGSVAEFAKIVPCMGDLLDSWAELGDGVMVPMGRGAALAMARERLQEARRKVADKKRPPPHPKSTGLAAFVVSEAVPYTTPAAAAPVGPNGGSSSSSVCATKPTTAASSSSSSSSAAPAAAVDRITAACCNVYELQRLCPSSLHGDGDLMALGYVDGYGGRDPGLAGMHFSYSSESKEWSDGGYMHMYKHGLYNHVTAVCADAGNGLVWCAADNGARIKAFRAAEGAAPLNSAAACNRGQRNGMELQYTLASNPPGALGLVTGLHVQGTRVLAIKGSGRLCIWDIADLAPAAEERPGVYEEEVEEDSSEGGEEGTTMVTLVTVTPLKHGWKVLRECAPMWATTSCSSLPLLH